MAFESIEKALDFRDNYEKKVKEAADYLKKLIPTKMEFGITLGSGLGDIADLIDDFASIPYKDIPNFPTTTVPGHEGSLIIGKIDGLPIIGLKGRKHFYEVADEPFNTGMLQAVFPVHVLAELGVPNYFATNAVGGLNPNYNVGDMMIINSHINLQPNPLLGRHHDLKRVDDNSRLWRFQPMNDAYDPELREMLRKASSGNEEKVHEGVYLAVIGPSYETEAECRAFRDGLKADAVGMSVAAEAIVARNRGMKVVALSCITNKIAEDGTNAANHAEVQNILNSRQVKDMFANTIQAFFRRYN